MARMLKLMRETIPQNGLLGNGPGKEIYQSLMDQELARKISQRGGVGLGEKLYRQVLKREERPGTPSPEGALDGQAKIEERKEP